MGPLPRISLNQFNETFVQLGPQSVARKKPPEPVFHVQQGPNQMPVLQQSKRLFCGRDVKPGQELQNVN